MEGFETKEEFWRRMMSETIELMQEEGSDAIITPRELLLNFYFIHFEKLHEYRNDILNSYGTNVLKIALLEIRSYRSLFQNYMKTVIDLAIEEDVIKDLKLLNSIYLEGLWAQLLFLINFWMKDDSNEFEHTDALIEKSVNSTFDVLERKELSSTLDLWKFYFQQFNSKRKNGRTR